MPYDFSMCNNDQCPAKDQCYRYKAKPSDYQWYTTFQFDQDKGCPDYIKLNPYKADRHDTTK